MAETERYRSDRKEFDEVRATQNQELKKGAPLDKELVDSNDKAAADFLEHIMGVQKGQGASTEDKIDTLLRELKGLRRTQEVTIEKLETQTLVQAYILAVTSPYELHKTPSSAEPNWHAEENLACDLFYEYRLDRDRVQGKESYVCQATGKALPSGGVLGYLFPTESAGYGPEWGIADPASDIKNALWWYEGIDEAWKELRICLEYVGVSLRLRVLDKTLLDKCLVDLAGSWERTRSGRDVLGDMTFRDLDEQEIYFPADVNTRPYQRIIATQAANAITKMWKLGRLRDDIEKFRLDVLEDFPTKRVCLEWIRTMMVHIPDWPVGPEPKV